MNIRSLLEEGQPLPANCHYTLGMAKQWLLTQPENTKAVVYTPKTGEITCTLRYKGKEGKLNVFEANHV